MNISNIKLQNVTTCFRKIINFHIVNIAFVDMKTQSCPYRMKAIYSSSPRIDSQKVVFFVIYYFQYVGMAANEKIGLIFFNQGVCPPVISPGIASDVGHQDFHSLAVEESEQWIVIAEFLAVAVAVNSFERLECGNCAVSLEIPEIPGVPYFIDRLQKIPERLVESAVRV